MVDMNKVVSSSPPFLDAVLSLAAGRLGVPGATASGPTLSLAGTVEEAPGGRRGNAGETRSGFHSGTPRIQPALLQRWVRGGPVFVVRAHASLR